MASGVQLPDLLGIEPVFLLTIDWNGRIYRFSTETVAIDTTDGLTFNYDGQLPETEFAEHLKLFSAGADPQSIEFSLDFPDDVAEIIERGHDLAHARGELALWIRGDTFDKRFKLLTGRIKEPFYGDEFEPVTFSLEEEPFEDQGIWPPTDAVITKDTWPDADENVLGKVYPWPFGTPGSYTEADGSVGKTSGSPAYVVDTVNGFVLVGFGLQEATQVTLIEPEMSRAGVATIFYQDDGQGRTCALIAFPASGLGPPVTYDAGNDYWVRFDIDGGGARLQSGPGIQDGMGSLLRTMLRKSTLRLHGGQIATVEFELNRYRASGVIASHVTPWEWIKQHILPILPVSIVAGPKGLQVIVWRWEASAIHAKAPLENGRNCTRRGRVEYVRDQVANEISIDFVARARQGGDYRRRRTVTGRDNIDKLKTADGKTRSDVFTNDFAKASVTRMKHADGPDSDGIRFLGLQSDIVTNTETADLILRDKSIAFAFPWRIIAVDGDMELADYSRGDQVPYTDASLHMVSLLALVIDAGISDVAVELILQIIPNPDRDLVATT